MKKFIKYMLIIITALAALAGAAVLFKKFAEENEEIDQYDGEAMFIG